MSTTTNIRAYFATALTSLNLDNLTQEGQRSDTQANQTWTRVKMLPNETVNRTLGGQNKRLTGLVQIDVFVPRLKGLSAAEVIADSLIASFPSTSSSLVDGSQIIIYSAWQEGVREEPAYLHIPVMVRYEVNT